MGVTPQGGALEFDALIKDSAFEATIKKIEKDLQSLTSTAEKEGKAIEGYAKKVGQALTAYLSFTKAADFVREVIRVRGEFQQLEVAFKTMLGNKEKADKLLSEATQLAAKTPFTLQDVGSGAKQLLAYGFGAQEVTDTLRRLGDVASGVGAPLNDIVYLYGTTRTQGRLYTQDLMQFTSRGIPVIAMLAKQFDVAESEVKGLVEAGKVGFPEIEKVIKSLTSEGGMFFNLMEEQSKTLTGQISNLEDAWDRMLNDIGKSNEGLLNGAIQAAISLVENYETVLDILKVLVFTYGAYRAALIATSITTTVYDIATKRLLITQTLQATASNIASKAMAFLNKTMLSNPAVAVATAIAAVASAVLIFGNKTKEATINIEGYNSELLKEKENLEYLFNAATKSADKTNERKDAISEINKQYGEYLPNILSETASNADLTKAYTLLNKKIEENIALKYKQKSTENLQKEYGDANDTLFNDIVNNVKSRSGVLESAKAARELIDLSKKYQEVSAKITDITGNGVEKMSDAQAKLRQERQKLLSDFFQKFKLEGSADDVIDYLNNDDALKKGLADIEAFWGAYTKANKDGVDNADKTLQDYLKEKDFLSVYDKAIAKATNKAQYDLIKKKLEEDKALLNSAKVKDQGTIDKYLAKLKDVQIYLDRYTGKPQKNAETEAEKQAKKLKALEEAVSDAERRARQSGLTKEESEIDKINARYDELKKKIQDLKAEGIKVDRLYSVRVEAARRTEVINATSDQDVAEYKKSLEAQKKIFEQYEDAKKDIGEENAKALFAEQTKGFDSFTDYLKGELKNLNAISTLDVGVNLSNAVGEELVKAQREQREREYEEQVKLFSQLLKASQSFEVKKAEINKKYDDLERANNARSTLKGYEDRKKMLEKGRKEELQELSNQAIRESDIYKRMNEDIIGFTRTQIKDLIKTYRAQLAKGEITDAFNNPIKITPEMQADIDAYIKKLQEILKATGQGAKESEKFTKIATAFGDVANIFGSIADGVSEFNSELADTISTIGDLASLASSAATAAASFASGDILGGIGATVDTVTKLFSIGKKAREEARRQKEEMEAFNLNIFKGEQEINLLYQQRAREQVKINKLRLEGLEAEKELLEAQTKTLASQYDTVLAELQKQTAKVTKTIDVLGVPITMFSQESLVGKTYDQLEELFIKGQLEGKAKELFELLQKLKEQGEDVNSLLEENKAAAQEIFTGTTADSITDSIIDGFKNGLHSAEDFADTFEELMQNAVLNALKYQTLEAPLKEFYAQFATDAESDGILTDAEIATLKEKFNAIIQNAGDKFDELQQITNIDLASGSSSTNSLSKAIKGITSDQADLLAGQFGGLRTTALDQLRVAQSALSTLQAIQNHTSNIEPIYRLMQNVALNGLKVK